LLVKLKAISRKTDRLEAKALRAKRIGQTALFAKNTELLTKIL